MNHTSNNNPSNPSNPSGGHSSNSNHGSTVSLANQHVKCRLVRLVYASVQTLLAEAEIARVLCKDHSGLIPGLMSCLKSSIAFQPTRLQQVSSESILQCLAYMSTYNVPRAALASSLFPRSLPSFLDWWSRGHLTLEGKYYVLLLLRNLTFHHSSIKGTMLADVRFFPLIIATLTTDPTLPANSNPTSSSSSSSKQHHQPTSRRGRGRNTGGGSGGGGIGESFSQNDWKNIQLNSQILQEWENTNVYGGTHKDKSGLRSNRPYVQGYYQEHGGILSTAGVGEGKNPKLYLLLKICEISSDLIRCVIYKNSKVCV